MILILNHGLSKELLRCDLLNRHTVSVKYYTTSLIESKVSLSIHLCIGLGFHFLLFLSHYLYIVQGAIEKPSSGVMQLWYNDQTMHGDTSNMDGTNTIFRTARGAYNV